MVTNTKESGIESLIVKWLAEHNGYEQGHNHDYSMEYALDTVRLFRFLKDTQPDAVDKLQLETNPQKKAQFLARVRDEITKRGIIDVLRKGVKAYPASLVMFYMTPSINNPAAAELYAKNIFSVTRQLHFSPDETKLSLDLCVFINGLPVITFELKNQLTKQNGVRLNSVQSPWVFRIDTDWKTAKVKRRNDMSSATKAHICRRTLTTVKMHNIQTDKRLIICKIVLKFDADFKKYGLKAARRAPQFSKR